MLNWQALAVSAPLLFVTYQALAKALPKGTSVLLANAYASAIGVVIMLILHLLTQTDKSFQLPSKSLVLALGMGLFISLGNFGIIKSYSLGAPQSTFTVLFYISLIIYGIVFGLFLWNEKLQLIQVAGIGLAIVGVFMAVFFRK